MPNKSKAELLSMVLGVDIPTYLAEQLAAGKTFRDIEFDIRTKVDGRDVVSAQTLNVWANQWGIESPRARGAA